MTFTYRYLGTEPTCFVTIQKNAYPGVPLESDVPLSHPLLELVEDAPEVKEVAEVKELKPSAVVPETTESPVSGDELKEN